MAVIKSANINIFMQILQQLFTHARTPLQMHFDNYGRICMHLRHHSSLERM